MGISEKIKILLIKRGMSQTEIADKCLGITKNYFNNKLRQEKFTREELEKMAEYLDAKYNEDPPPRQWFTLTDTGEEI
jgi:transcriptional regulator with XRE-family HTH domain